MTLVDLDLDRLKKAAAQLEGAEQRIRLVAADVAQEADVQRYVSETIEAFGRLDISAQIAGITHQQVSIIDLDAEVFDRVMKVNSRGRKRRALVRRSSC